MGIIEIPIVIADCAPLIKISHLHPSWVLSPIHQSYNHWIWLSSCQQTQKLNTNKIYCICWLLLHNHSGDFCKLWTIFRKNRMATALRAEVSEATFIMTATTSISFTCSLLLSPPPLLLLLLPPPLPPPPPSPLLLLLLLPLLLLPPPPLLLIRLLFPLWLLLPLWFLWILLLQWH